MKKTKIVLDADVIIHFAEAGCFALLSEIFPEYEYLLLDVVYNEVTKRATMKNFIDNYLRFIPKIRQEPFAPHGESLKEYFNLQRNFGAGESACMVYCRDNQDVLGSSNLRDIKSYCMQHGITYLTTLDFLYYAYVRKKLTAEECFKFVEDVNQAGSKLPVVDITTYTCTVQL